MNREIFSMLKNEGFPVAYLYSLKGFQVVLRSKYLLFSHDVRNVSYFMWLPGKFNKVQLWHGIATKGFGKPPTFNKNTPLRKKLVLKLLIRDRKSYHIIITCSENSKKRDVGLFQNKNVKILGFPRNDIFFNKSGIFDDLYTKYDLNNYDKVILYCPTWRENADERNFGKKVPFSSDFLKELNIFLKNKNFIMLIKKHNSEKGKRLDIPNFSNIRNISKEIDIQEVLIFSDIIITDYSSVFRDFCLTGRPMIFYLFDYDEYSKNKGRLYTDYFNEVPGLLAMKEIELLNLLMNIDTVTSDVKYKEKYEHLVNTNHFYQNGNSSERLYNHLFNS
jgi:CDP-glycerol glycerophosphotransferase (TagB/SpsB family)